MKTENKKIINWATFCAATGTDEKLPFDVSMLPEEEQKYHEAAHRLPLVIKHFRDGVKLDYTPGNRQLKYEPYFRIKPDASKPSGFALSNSDCDYVYEFTTVGSRFVSLDLDSMRHIAENFIGEYEKLHLVKQ